MSYLHNNYFIHIPKTGGNSIKNILKDNNYTIIGGHINIQTILDTQNNILQGFDNLDSYFFFAFVRNPYSRLVSTYKYFKSGRMKGPDGAYFLHNFPTFNDFCYQYVLKTEDSLLIDHCKPQHFFITYKGNIRTNYIGKQENMEQDMNYLKNRLNLNFTKIPKLNKSDKYNEWEKYYTIELKELIYTKYQKDFELFDYS